MVAIKIKIKAVPKYMLENRLVKVGDIYKIKKIGKNYRQKTVYLFESKNKKVSLVYDHEVEIV